MIPTGWNQGEMVHFIGIKQKIIKIIDFIEFDLFSDSNYKKKGNKRKKKKIQIINKNRWLGNN